MIDGHCVDLDMLYNYAETEGLLPISIGFKIRL